MDTPLSPSERAILQAKQAIDAAAFETAERLLHEALPAVRDAGDALGEVRMLAQLGAVLRAREQGVAAVTAYLDALALARQTGAGADDIGPLATSLAFNLVHLGLPDQAAEHAAAAFEAAASMTDAVERVRALNAVALTQTRLGHHAAARATYWQAMRASRRTPGAQRERWRALLNFGVCVHDEAMDLPAQHADRARLLRRQLRCNRVAGALAAPGPDSLLASLNDVDALIELDQLDEADRRLRGLQLRLTDPHRKEFAAHAEGFRGNLHLRRKAFELARLHLLRCVDGLEQLGTSEDLAPGLDMLSQAEEGCGNLIDALHTARRAAKLRRAVSRAQSDARMRVVEVRNGLDKARQAVETERARSRSIELERAALSRETDRLAQDSRTDALTGLGNRRLLSEAFALLNTRHGERFSLALMDLDHFKSINDRWSHQVGDKVLQTVGELVRASSRPSDVVVRYGGEEIAIVFRQTTLHVAAKVCERLRVSIESFDWQALQHGLAVTASFGLSSGQAPTDLEHLLSLADQCLYRAKETGRNRICTADGV
jgi:diguanylate cyclase (GGDEF)-like protein